MHVTVVLDCSEPERLAHFWTSAIGYRREAYKPPYLVLLPQKQDGSPELVLQRVAEAKAGKNRMHIDLHTIDVDSECERLMALGATRVSDEVVEGGFRWYVLADPEGNEFCVVGRASEGA
jgi:predicted enzyme related to lactoylglutathione lyase